MKRQRKTKEIYRYQPTERQTNPDNFRVEGNSVCYWKGDTLITAQMTEERARHLLATGAAFIISANNIGAMVDGYAL